jgi:L-lactate dehydrogenase (cytochrome)
MHEPKAVGASAPQKGGLAWGVTGSAREIARRRQFPTVEDLRQHARKRVPRFGFEYVDGGAGLDRGVARNAAALDAIELVARYGVEQVDPPLDVTLFGRSYAAPLGIAPMGLPALMWPGAELHLARAAQRARIPYTAGTVGGVALERLGELAPDVLWFQLYRLPGNDHAVAIDLVRRAQGAGAHVLVLTLDVPARTKRPRELRNGLLVPFKLSPRMVYEALTSPAWLMALLRHGQPTFANLAKYAGANASAGEIAGFTQREVRGAFTWDEVKRFRDLWRGPLVVKGILHPADAIKAVSLGVDGIQVSNHGGRQLEAAPPSIDVLPAIAAAVGGKAALLFDGGVRSGLDVVRALALGATAAIAGRAFLYALGALGKEGPAYVIELLSEEIRTSLRQLGVLSLDGARALAIRHPGAMHF